MDKILPQTKAEWGLYTVDAIGIIVTTLVQFKEVIEMWILIATAISVGITAFIKLYNAVTPNEKNKKL